MVEHACDAIEAEAVKLILVHPEPQVAEQEPHHLVVTIIKESAVPQIVATSAAFVEILVIRSIEVIQAIEDVLGSMAMHDVEQHSEAHSVGRVDKFLEVLWRPVPAAGGEEVVDLVAKACVVCMLHDGHELDDVVTEATNPGKHVLGKFFVRGNTQFRR